MPTVRSCARDTTLDAVRNGILSRSPYPIAIDIDWLGGRLVNMAPLPAPVDPESDRRIVVRFDLDRVHFVLFDRCQTSNHLGAPCPQCFDHRAIANLPAEVQWAIQTDARIDWPAAPPLPQLLIERIVLVAAALMESGARDGPRPVSVNLRTGEIRRASLLADVFCACARDFIPPSAEARTIDFDPLLRAPAGRTRMRELGDYELPLDALIDPLCGAAGQEWIPGFAQSTTAPAYGSYWQRARGARPRRVGWSGLSARHGDSKLTGVLEALERQGGMQPPAPDQIPVRASLAALGDKAMDPTLCFAYNEASYALPLSLTRFDPALECDWIWGYSLTRRRPVLVPTALAFYHRLPVGSPFKLVDNNSSGCALGSCFEEAILKGLFELIERDSFSVTWLRQLSLPRIDTKGIGDVRINLLLGKLDYLGVDATLLDARLDIDLPAVIAVARYRDASIGSIAVGASVALDPLEAIYASLLEAGSAIVEVPAMLHHQEAHVRGLAADYNRVTSVTDHQLLYALPEMAAAVRWLDGGAVVRSFAQTFSAGRSVLPHELGAGIVSCLELLRAVGLDEVVVVDQTSREQAALGFKTLRAIVPGLAPIDFGHPRNRAESLPRLWSAPAAAGLQGARSLNLMPHPFP